MDNIDNIEFQIIEREEYSQQTYLTLMKRIFVSRGQSERFHVMTNWIRETDFFEAPASSRFHGCFKEGLLYHHFDVYNQMLDLMKLDKYKDVNAISAALTALTHDWCKIGLYETYMKNVKDDETGVWNKVQAYRYAKPQFPLGHGVASMYLVNKFIPLNLEESLAIRWHMGEYNCCQNEMSELQEARDNYPLVQMLQMADRLAITSY